MHNAIHIKRVIMQVHLFLLVRVRFGWALVVCFFRIKLNAVNQRAQKGENEGERERESKKANRKSGYIKAIEKTKNKHTNAETHTHTLTHKHTQATKKKYIYITL
jgi:hypothetical protein